MNQEQFEKALNGNMAYINDETLVIPEVQNVRVIVLPTHVKKMLRSFLQNEIDAETLKRWAQFISFRTEYSGKNPEDDDAVEYYTDMWDIILMTSTPELDYELTPETIRRYLKVLEKYDD